MTLTHLKTRFHSVLKRFDEILRVSCEVQSVMRPVYSRTIMIGVDLRRFDALRVLSDHVRLLSCLEPVWSCLEPVLSCVDLFKAF